MSDPVLNNMLRPAASSSSAAKLQNVPKPANRELRVGEDSFSRALERRMNSGEQSTQATRERAAQPAREPQRNGQPVRERSERGADGRARETNRSAADGKAEADAPGNARPSAGARAPEEARAAGDDASSAARDGTSDPASQSEANPAAAASLAAAVPNIAALPPAPPLGDGDALPLDDGRVDAQGGKAGSSLLEKLIAEAAGRTAAGGDGGRGPLAAADDPAVTSGAQWKTGVDQIVAEATATPAKAQATTGAVGTSAAALQSLQADTQIGLQATGFAPVARSEQPQLPQLPVPTPAGQPAWAEDVGGRMVWMVGRSESKAELMLTPPSLGKLEVSIHVSGDQTTAHFVAATSAARDALEQAMPRLREVLQQAGINLGETNVSTSGEQQAQQHASGRQAGTRAGSAGTGAAGPERASPTGTHWVRGGNGMVDTFA